MKSSRTAQFLQRFRALLKKIQKQGISSYRLWQENPQHPSLEFKDIILRSGNVIWSARINDGYRVLGKHKGDVMLWFWCGSHADYDEVIKQLRRMRGGNT